MLETVKGLVLREVAVGEKDKLLTVLTEELGQITVSAKGARSMKSPHTATAQLFAYSSMVLYKRGEFYWLREADLIEGFFGLHTDIVAYSLAAYLCHIAAEFAIADEDRANVLRMTLNALYTASKRSVPFSLLKGAFEFRLAAACGFEPDLAVCAACGNPSPSEPVFDLMNGQVLCGSCIQTRNLAPVKANTSDDYDIYESLEPVIHLWITPDTLAALRYLLRCPVERMFSFRLGVERRSEFSAVCEAYLLHHIERNFPTLDFYKKMAADLPPEE